MTRRTPRTIDLCPSVCLFGRVYGFAKGSRRCAGLWRRYRQDRESDQRDQSNFGKIIHVFTSLRGGSCRQGASRLRRNRIGSPSGIVRGGCYHTATGYALHAKALPAICPHVRVMLSDHIHVCAAESQHARLHRASILSIGVSDWRGDATRKGEAGRTDCLTISCVDAGSSFKPSNDISAYTINSTTGALTPISGSPFPSLGSEPISITAGRN